VSTSTARCYENGIDMVTSQKLSGIETVFSGKTLIIESVKAKVSL